MAIIPRDLGPILADALEEAAHLHAEAAASGRHFHDSYLGVRECSYPSRCEGVDPLALIEAMCRSAAQTARSLPADERAACVHRVDGLCERCGREGYDPLGRAFDELRFVVGGRA